MNNTLKIIMRVVGVLHALFGLLTLCTATVLLFGMGIGSYAETLAKQAGETLNSYPYGLSIIAGIIALLLTAAYFTSAFSLLTLKKWAYIAVAVVGVLGLIDGIYLLVTNYGINYADFVWGVIYLGFAGYLYTQKENTSKK